jgi:hypothetical protein
MISTQITSESYKTISKYLNEQINPLSDGSRAQAVYDPAEMIRMNILKTPRMDRYFNTNIV